MAGSTRMRRVACSLHPVEVAAASGRCIWLGGAAIAAGLDVASVNWVGGLTGGAGLLAALASVWLERNRPAEAAAHHD
ncbi:hypothetical protein [Saccharopolyspora shandongensis]|uniref:hypothetical protein n=1 Tax=Saccharopolyspora shandongensis TaxID=418495 RepID=UPI0033EC9519